VWLTALFSAVATATRATAICCPVSARYFRMIKTDSQPP
jgi:hypothetical protein